MDVDSYRASDYGPKEETMMRKYFLQKDDSRNYFVQYIKPRLDKSYKLYIAYAGDRQAEIQNWQANVFIPYIQAVVETLMPRILDARPDFTVQGRTQDDQLKAMKLQQLADYTWEIANMDPTSELVTRASLMFGTGFLQAYWKRDERTLEFVKKVDYKTGKVKTKRETKMFYEGPYAEWVDNYDLWYDWHNKPGASKQYWFRRKILNAEEIRRRYPLHDKRRLEQALKSGAGDIQDYGRIRYDVKATDDKVVKGAGVVMGGTSGNISEIYKDTSDPELKMNEVFEWWRPFDDAYAVMVNDVPILRPGYIPNPYDFKEAPFVDIPYLKLPNEYEGIGLPLILESPQNMINMIKNQRLDATSLNIHKMWVVNPLANIDKKELVTRPFGIIYSTDPAGVREVQFSDIKASAYKEEELLKSDMRYASGVDDFSMGVGGGAGSATEVRHLRESTLERVRLFVNHLGDGFSSLMRWWMDMYRQFYTEAMTIRVIGEDGRELYPLIEKDDLMGRFDYKASVIPSIAGKQDIDKKQSMDLFQLLINMPFIDPQKLTNKVLHNWNWTLDGVMKQEEPMMPGMPGMEGGQPGVDPMMAGMAGMPGAGMPEMAMGPAVPAIRNSGEVPADKIQAALAMLEGGAMPAGSPFAQMATPVNLLEAGGLPPTAPGLNKGATTNPRGLNRGGAVNTNIPVSGSYQDQGAKLLNQANNIQR